jgi:hypothetical protein
LREAENIEKNLSFVHHQQTIAEEFCGVKNFANLRNNKKSFWRNRFDTPPHRSSSYLKVIKLKVMRKNKKKTWSEQGVPWRFLVNSHRHLRKSLGFLSDLNWLKAQDQTSFHGDEAKAEIQERLQSSSGYCFSSPFTFSLLGVHQILVFTESKQFVRRNSNKRLILELSPRREM